MLTAPARRKINGNVTLAMIVTAEGRVRDLKIVKSLDKDFDKQALNTVSTWRFEPGTKDGKPVAVHLSRRYIQALLGQWIGVRWHRNVLFLNGQLGSARSVLSCSALCSARWFVRVDVFPGSLRSVW